MHQTRQFTKRRPQSPLISQQQSVDGLQVGVNKPRSGLAIQSNAPIHMNHRAVETELHDKVITEKRKKGSRVIYTYIMF